MAALNDANGNGGGSAGHIAGTDHGPPRQRLPGSDGEHALQQRIGSDGRANRFYQDQVLGHLNERMREFTRQQEMFFLATADRHGECDNSFRAGPPGFLRVLDERTLVFPEYRGNGVHASLGNIQENPHVGLLLIDFLRARIGLHINGRAEVLDDAELRPWVPDLPQDPVPGRRAVLWVRVEVEEAYIHCAKHIPHLQKAPRRPAREWGTDDYKRKGGDFFGAARDAREARRDAAASDEKAPSTSESSTPAASTSAPSTSASSASARSTSAPSPQIPSPRAAEVPAPKTPVSGGADEVEGGRAEETLTLAAPPLPSTPAIPPVPGTPPEPATPPMPTTPPVPGTEPGTEPAHAQLTAAEPAVRPDPSDEREQTAEPEQAPRTVSGAGPAPLPRRRHAAASAAVPAASSAVSAAMSARSGNGGTVEHARDISAWRLEAERALAEAQRRGRSAEPEDAPEPSPFQGWFG
ncbi:pyridoxamine 5'-phosphate oxidase family protein [Streptomyces smyrnaeus]|uniref:pyridoxamine 5'-phosphate oxidase family protein n=1 Tax=Streptomyces smyrnaeus TaxID=1387713 RepID=UPI003F4C26E8